MATVRFHRLAAREYERARDWYRVQSGPAVERFAAEVDRVVGKIASDPRQGNPYSGDVRWLRLRRYPYVFYFQELSPTVVVILAVAHARRRPGYWHRRVNRP